MTSNVFGFRAEDPPAAEVVGPSGSSPGTDPERLSATVAVRCFNDPPDMLRECLEHLLAQRQVDFDLVVIDSSTNTRPERICRELAGIRYDRIAETDISSGRNRALEIARHRFVAFTDPDCLPDPMWLFELTQLLVSGATIAGGKVLAKWHGSPPLLLRRSSIARSLWSLLDYGDRTVEVDRVFGANFAMDTVAVGARAFFRTDLARRPGKLTGGQETELCVRVRETGGTVIYTPRATVYHQIPASRLRYGWMLKRIHHGAISRGVSGRRPNPVNRNYTLADFLLGPLFAVPYVAGLARGRWIGARHPTRHRSRTADE